MGLWRLDASCDPRCQHRQPKTIAALWCLQISKKQSYWLCVYIAVFKELSRKSFYAYE